MLGIKQLSNIFSKKMECPICGFEGRSFNSFGSPPRKNAQCPKCMSLERMRMTWHYLVNEKNILNFSGKLLHIAPDRGLYKKFKALSKLDYTAGDFFAESYSYEEGVIKLDITDINFPDNTFDALICVHVLEHIVDDAKAMSEVLRVLKPGGWAILQVPIDHNRTKTYEDFSIVDPKERIKHFGQFDHVRQYGLDYGNRLSNAGFDVDVIDYVKKVGEKEATKCAFTMKDDIYVCYKKK